ncbi:MAG: TolC family protein [Planctomycetes bacterium]|nr:TolC family protein [Planctomycetota bacterium]
MAGNGLFERLFQRSLRLFVVVGAILFSQSTARCEEPNQQSQAESMESATELTLVELVALGESNSPVLRQAASEIESTRGRAYQAGLYPNPVAIGGATQIAGRESQYFASLSQEIVTKHKLQLNQAAVCKEVVQAEWKFVQSRFELLTAIRQNYVMTLAAQRRMEILQKLVEIAEKSHKAAHQLQKAGEGTRSDTLLFEIEIDKAELNLENADARRMASQYQLSATLGLRDLSIGRLKGDLTESLEAVMAQVQGSDSYLENAETQFARHDVDRNRILLERAKVEPFPNVTISGGYQYQVMPLHNMGLLQASVPLPLWNRNEGNISSANAQVMKATATVELVQNQIAKQMAELSGRYRTADQQVRRYSEKIVPKAREGVTIIQEGFSQGQFDFLRLLQAQRTLVEATLGYIDALEARWLAAAEMAGIAQLEVFP